MADREEFNKRYAYHEMSSKVEQADRSLLRRRYREPTGEVESLRGRTDIGHMGDRVVKTEKKEFATKIERARKKRQKREHSSATTAAGSSRNILAASGGQSILDLGDLTGYQPSTDGARAAYENLLVCTISVSSIACLYCFSFSLTLIVCLRTPELLHLLIILFLLLLDHDWLSISFG